MNNNKYLKPTIEVIEIKKSDIITTSGPQSVTEALFGPGKDGVKL